MIVGKLCALTGQLEVEDLIAVALNGIADLEHGCGLPGVSSGLVSRVASPRSQVFVAGSWFVDVPLAVTKSRNGRRGQPIPCFTTPALVQWRRAAPTACKGRVQVTENITDAPPGPRTLQPSALMPSSRPRI